MHKKIVLLSILLLPMILVGASCTTSTEQTNANKEQTAASVTPTPTAENSATPSATPSAENTNANGVGGGETNTNSSVDTSDWLTYENTEYGLKFSYPKNWGSVILSEEKISNGTGKKYSLTFSNDTYYNAEQGVYSPAFLLMSRDYSETIEGDVPTPVNPNQIDVSKNDQQIADLFVNGFVTNAVIERLKTTMNVPVIKVLEQGKNLAGENFSKTSYYIPISASNAIYNLQINIKQAEINVVEDVITTIEL